jgi:hypothetical protein
MDTIAEHLQRVYATSVFLLAYCREAHVMDTNSAAPVAGICIFCVPACAL